MVRRPIPEGVEVQTCPDRVNGPWYEDLNADWWGYENWRFTDPAEAAAFNQAEADKQNAEHAAQGNKSHTYPNLRYWLWPGPGPKPRICSYCGSVHPDDALRLKREFKFDIEPSTKGYKLYMHPPGFNRGMNAALTNMRKGEDPIESLGLNEVQEIYPPLKLYGSHYTDAEWRELLG